MLALREQKRRKRIDRMYFAGKEAALGFQHLQPVCRAGLSDKSFGMYMYMLQVLQRKVLYRQPPIPWHFQTKIPWHEINIIYEIFTFFPIFNNITLTVSEN